MKKTKQLITLFVSALVVAPMSGCSPDEEVGVCYDNDYDNYCDDSGKTYDKNSYVVIDGVKQRLFIDEDSFDDLRSGFGRSELHSNGG
ncbi:hypothetical protein SAMN05444392_105119 [Seinonella peptonophila]|uniref:Uncharacterized protein n=1 Tax=Seinonella peptonophila TaxID=112248 RepID=A0A1M4XQ32_9BACL|nr:hypothetical protein [Seinonella peptonophila]SHE95609.1 hypothetical protein SAMN05444392_105119 [Seinonella peptonophila]